MHIFNKKIFLIIFFLIVFILLVLIFKTNVSTTKEFSIKSSTKQAVEELTLISTGDVGLVRDIDYKIRQSNDPNYPFLKIGTYLKNADLTVINLEGPLLKNCPIILTGFTFCGKDSNALGLTFAGIDVASLANNHTTNYGLEGLSETASALSANNIKPFGLDQEIKYIYVKGKKIALLGFVELGNNWAGLNNATSENVSSLVLKASKSADIVIVAFHWGIEYTRKPTSNQILLAHLAVDNGADIILGNHPHWIQTSEIYKNKFITYAQGNTVFDQDWSEETKEGIIYKFSYKNGNFEKVDEKYTIIEGNTQPRFANDDEVSKIKLKIEKDLEN